MVLGNQTNMYRKLLTIGGILFALTILFFQIFFIKQDIDYMKGNPYNYQEMLNNPFSHWGRVLLGGTIFGACAGIIVLIIYGLNLFILNIYKNIHSSVHKVMFWLIIPLIYVGIYLYKSFIITNTNYNGWQGLGHALVLMFIFGVLMLSYIGLVIYCIVKHIKNSH